MGLGAARLRIAPRRGAAARVLSRRNAGKSSWRRAVSKSSQVRWGFVDWTVIVIELSQFQVG